MRPPEVLIPTVTVVTAVILVMALAAPTSVASTVRGPAAPSAQEPLAEQEERAIDKRVEEEEHGETEWYVYPARWTNFLLLLALLYWVLVIPPKPIHDTFDFPGLKVILSARAQSIIAARDVAARQREEAAALLTASEERLAKIDDEVGALVEVARADAARERERAEVDAKEQAQRIPEIAERELQSERLTAHRQLRAFVADLAVGMAQRTLEEHLSDDDQDRLIRDYLSRLGGSLA